MRLLSPFLLFSLFGLLFIVLNKHLIIMGTPYWRGEEKEEPVSHRITKVAVGVLFIVLGLVGWLREG